jgi:hypothetical protein
MTVVKSRFRANSHDNADELFCSELVALALMSLGVITGDRLVKCLFVCFQSFLR